jgi:uncharacterized protein (TIGR03084 family)
MDPDVPELVDALTEQQDELASVLDGLSAERWQRPTRCPGWDVADVVLHLAQTDELAVASLEGRFADELEGQSTGLGQADSVDDGAALLVARDRGAGPQAVHDRWRAGVAALRSAIAATDPSARVQWVAGDLAARTLTTTRLAETWIHTGDVAEALGIEPAPTARLWHIARLAWRTLPYAFAGDGRALAGPVAFELTAPSGASWSFDDGQAATVVRGDAVELCGVAARRVDAAATSLTATGPDGADVLRLVRTYA